ncbi:hypothetical protein VB779_08130 [Haloarculaceae archaeon H-GB11]|nr:hypothetical protein [Haloarculaceae archaeon H-GB11]
MKLRTKFALAILVVMVVLSVVVLGSVELFKQRTVAEEQQDLNETADLTAEQIATVVQIRKGRSPPTRVGNASGSTRRSPSSRSSSGTRGTSPPRPSRRTGRSSISAGTSTSPSGSRPSAPTWGIARS